MPSLGPVLCIESTEITEQFRGPQDRPLVLSSLGLVLRIESTEINKQFRGPQDRPWVLSSLGPVLSIESTEINKQFRGPQECPLVHTVVLSSWGPVLSIESTEIYNSLEVHRAALLCCLADRLANWRFLWSLEIPSRFGPPWRRPTIAFFCFCIF